MTPEERQKCVCCPYSMADGKYYCVLSAMPIIDEYSQPEWCCKEKHEAQITKRMIEEAVKDLTKDGQFQWRDGQVYAEEIIDWLDKEGEG